MCVKVVLDKRGASGGGDDDGSGAEGERKKRKQGSGSSGSGGGGSGSVDDDLNRIDATDGSKVEDLEAAAKVRGLLKTVVDESEGCCKD